jgi:hypothetical protein
MIKSQFVRDYFSGKSRMMKLLEISQFEKGGFGKVKQLLEEVEPYLFM